MDAFINTIEESKEYYFPEGCYILECLPHKKNPALSVARARVKPGVRTRLHSLDGTAEHYIIQSGEGRMFLGDDEEGQMVGPNDVVVIPPTVAQAIENTGKVDLVFLAVCTPSFEPTCYIDLEDSRGE
jgi:mannose-6-phosphate isomerase-like protein (cupin superfamily)|tara:strand:- start:8031 stop:8414 length:384 start_codon:yes stop_codon:yes gene_type:complete